MWTGRQKVFVKSSDVALGVWKSSSPETRDRLLLSKHIKHTRSFKKWHKGPGINIGDTWLFTPGKNMSSVISNFISAKIDFFYLRILTLYHTVFTYFLLFDMMSLNLTLYISFEFISSNLTLYIQILSLYITVTSQMISCNSVFLILTFISQLHSFYFILLNSEFLIISHSFVFISHSVTLYKYDILKFNLSFFNLYLTVTFVLF